MANGLTPPLQQRPCSTDSEEYIEDREQLVKSRQRVKSYGEVFTPSRMVHQMLNLVRAELETGPRFVDKTFFEPAAGDGNFLLAILHRKLRAIRNRYQPEFWPTESLFALASIYGIELLEDNHDAAKIALLGEFVLFHQQNGVSCNNRTNLWRSAKYLIDANILQGNTLTGRDASGNLIEFSWWHRLLNVPGMVQREPFSLSSLRHTSMGSLDFTVYATYRPSRIEHVYKGERADD